MFFIVCGYEKARRLQNQPKLNSYDIYRMSCTCFGRTSQRKAQGDEMRTKLVEGLTAFATRRGFLQTAASACGDFGLAYLGADVTSGVSAYCCGLCLSPSTCTSCACKG